MATSPEAIERFLSFHGPAMPAYKGMDPARLAREMYDCTGKPFQPITEPRPWQTEGLAFALYCRRALLFYSMRLGKSKVALDWARHLKHAGLWKGKGLVIAHAPIGIDVWMGEAKKHSDLKLYPVRTSANELIQALESDCDLIVTPWSGLQALFSVKRQVTHGAKAGKQKLYPDYNVIRDAAQFFSLCIMDEIHFCKNHQSLRFKIAETLTTDCKFRLGLTGTPIGRNPFAVWAQAYLIDRGRSLSSNYYFFQEAFGKQKRNYFSGLDEWTFDQKKMPILQKKLVQVALSYKFEEVHNVEVLDGVVELQMSTDQRKAYQQIIEGMIKLKRGEEQEIKNVFIRLRQAASGFIPFIDEDGNQRIVTFPNCPKLQWLEDLVESLPDKMQAVIFHEFTKSGELICAKLSEMKISHSWLYGGSKDRSQELHNFQHGKSRIFVVNAATGGAGIDLSMADYLVFYESPVDPIVRQQAEARPMARTSTLLRDDLVCAPIERKILEFVKEGKDLLKEILRDPRRLA